MTVQNEVLAAEDRFYETLRPSLPDFKIRASSMRYEAPAVERTLWFLKHDLARDRGIVEKLGFDGDEAFSGIRCPVCRWRPAPSSTWSCDGLGTPEPSFAGCGTSWNTFSTRGRCPGCFHQWRWTSCLRCNAWSLHEDWYEEG